MALQSLPAPSLAILSRSHSYKPNGVKLVVYDVAVKWLGKSWTLGKRFSDCLAFRDQLLEAGLHGLPAMPPKSRTLKSDRDYLDTRQDALQAFLRGAMAVPAVRHSPIAHSFLECEANELILGAAALAHLPRPDAGFTGVTDARPDNEHFRLTTFVHDADRKIMFVAGEKPASTLNKVARGVSRFMARFSSKSKAKAQPEQLGSVTAVRLGDSNSPATSEMVSLPHEATALTWWAPANLLIVGTSAGDLELYNVDPETLSLTLSGTVRAHAGRVTGLACGSPPSALREGDVTDILVVVSCSLDKAVAVSRVLLSKPSTHTQGIKAAEGAADQTVDTSAVEAVLAPTGDADAVPQSDPEPQKAEEAEERKDEKDDEAQQQEKSDDDITASAGEGNDEEEAGSAAPTTFQVLALCRREGGGAHYCVCYDAETAYAYVGASDNAAHVFDCSEVVKQALGLVRADITVEPQWLDSLSGHKGAVRGAAIEGQRVYTAGTGSLAGEWPLLSAAVRKAGKAKAAKRCKWISISEPAQGVSRLVRGLVAPSKGTPNAVAYSPELCCLAVGMQGGAVCFYDLSRKEGEPGMWSCEMPFNGEKKSATGPVTCLQWERGTSSLLVARGTMVTRLTVPEQQLEVMREQEAAQQQQDAEMVAEEQAAKEQRAKARQEEEEQQAAAAAAAAAQAAGKPLASSEEDCVGDDANPLPGQATGAEVNDKAAGDQENNSQDHESAGENQVEAETPSEEPIPGEAAPAEEKDDAGDTVSNEAQKDNVEVPAAEDADQLAAVIDETQQKAQVDPAEDEQACSPALAEEM